MHNLGAMVRKLSEGGVEFVLVGGYAAVAHGVSLVTRDVDVCCRFSAENLHRLAQVLADSHPRHRMTPQKLPLELTDELCARLKNLYLETDLCVLDCLSEIAGVGDYAAVARRSVEFRTPSGTFRVLDIDALIEAKLAMNRPQDFQAVEQLRAIKEKSLTRES
jgi:hypothetical protein